MSSTLDLVRLRGRALARDTFRLAGNDLSRCPHNPKRCERLLSDLGRAPTVDELRQLGHAYREELHALNAATEIAALAPR